MSKESLKTAISPTRKEDYPEWYQQVVKHAELAETSPVRGCMVIKPWGYAIWENIQKILDKKFKNTGHKNAYFPLFIPLSFMQKEAKHIEGFSKECAVVTHYRLETDKEGRLVPARQLEEPLIIRPSSETVIGCMFSKWIQSYRDLPLLINQWANIVRWEMRTRLFLRTSEFLWQEGHTAHATEKEAICETLKMLNIYAEFANQYLAMPVIAGEKTESERFPGAVNTYCIEAMMQDKKALQSGTSHFLGQNFARAFDIKFLSAAEKEVYAWTTSWGVSTRLIGGLIMTHSDDDGLVLPPRIAPTHAVILPIIHKDKKKTEILEYCEKLAEDIKKLMYHDQSVDVEVDASEERGGDKAWKWVKKGVPIRLEIGERELEANSVTIGHRDKLYKDRATIKTKILIETLVNQLDGIQSNLLERAQKFQKQHSAQIKTKEDLYHYFDPKNKDSGGFAYAYFHEDTAIEEQLKNDLKITVRCMPLSEREKKGNCIFTKKSNARLAIFAKAY